MNKTSALAVVVFVTGLCSCNQSSNKDSGNQSSTVTAASMTGTADKQKEVNSMLDSFNIAAANADYKIYFNFYTDDAIFTGTDATERWNKKEFMVWAKPYFDKKNTWHFTDLERHIYFAPSGTLAWFDELLNTQMKICRGSGVLVKENNGWKIMQYILSTTIPNQLLDSVTKMKTPIEDSIINSLSHQNKRINKN